MVNDTLTLVLSGQINLDSFTRALKGFYELVDSLQREVAEGTDIEWIITDLGIGSASATIQGRTKDDDPTPIHSVVEAYEKAAKAIQRGDTLPYSPSVRKSVTSITKVIGNGVRSVRFETQNTDCEIFEKTLPALADDKRKDYRDSSIGSVRGRVQSLSSRGSLRFTIFDTLKDRAVSCYLAPGSEDTMREVWGKLALVEGLVRRDPVTGNPTTLRNIKSVSVLPEQSEGLWREARGSAPPLVDSVPSETTVRKLRDF